MLLEMLPPGVDVWNGCCNTDPDRHSEMYYSCTCVCTSTYTYLRIEPTQFMYILSGSACMGDKLHVHVHVHVDLRVPGKKRYLRLRLPACTKHYQLTHGAYQRVHGGCLARFHHEC